MLGVLRTLRNIGHHHRRINGKRESSAAVLVDVRLTLVCKSFPVAAILYKYFGSSKPRGRT